MIRTMIKVAHQKHTPFGTSFNASQYIGIVMTGDPQQRHTGMYYRTGLDSQVHFLHLAFHFKLKREAPVQQHCWLAMGGLDAEEQQSLAIWFETIWEINGHRIPYGINYSDSPYFNSSGGIHTAASAEGGLTCATFILASFDAYGLPIIDAASAYPRDDDQEWQQRIIDALELYGHAGQAYVDNQRLFLGKAARYRPEEVAGAASVFLDGPLPFSDAVKLGAQVLQQMQGHGVFKLP
jgi:hypothetical protein